MEANNFFDLAKDLNQDALALRDAKVRTAISRCYYFIFNKVKQYLQKYGYEFRNKPADHQKILTVLNNTNNRKAQGLAIKVDGLRAKRNCADYDLHLEPFDPDDDGLLAIAETTRCERDLQEIENDNVLEIQS